MKRLCVVLLLASSGVFAAAITSKLDPALTGATLIDFESAAAGSFTSLTVAGVTFTIPTAGQVGYISTAYSGNYGAVGQSLQNTYASNAFGVLNIAFPTGVSAFAFNWGASDTQWTLTAYDNGHGLLETVLPAITRGSNDGYTGIARGTADIFYARLSGPSSDYIFVDDLKFVGTQGRVPEPSTWALLGTGLAGLLWSTRRRKSA